MRRVRQSTVEPAFDQLLPYYDLRRLGHKGQAAAHKMILLAAVAYNLKRLLKYRVKQLQILGLVIQSDILPAITRLFWRA